MRRPASLAALLLVSLLAGCSSDDGGRAPAVDGGVVDDGWAARALPSRGTDDKHDHEDVSHHANLTTPNFQVLGWDPLVTDYHRRPSGGYSCGTVVDTEERTIGVYNSFTTDVALVLVDLKDPLQPRKLGELILPLTHVYDASVTDDGLFAVLATSPLDTGPDLPPTYAAAAGSGAGGAGAVPTYAVRPTFRDACGRETQGPEANLPYASGLVLVDIRDPANPVVADYEPQPILGAHSVSAATIDGTTYVVASTTNLVHGASYYTFHTLLFAGDAVAGEMLPTLAPYGAFSAQHPTADALEPDVMTALNGHVDATLGKHPLTGEVLAYLANWNGGVSVVALDAPGRIRPVGYWNDHDPSKGSEMTGQIHSVVPLAEVRNGRHLTLVGQEIGGHPSHRPTGQALILDTTDPARPKAVARWTLPVDVQWDGGAMFSPHYLDLVGDTLFVSLYHGGIWAADASEASWPNLPSVGVFLPDRTADAPFSEGVFPWRPLTIEVGHLRDGTLVTVDHATGVYTLRFTPDDPRVPPVGPWTEDRWTPDP